VIHRLIDFPRINDAPGVRALSRHRDTPQLHPLCCQAFEPIVLLVKIWEAVNPLFTHRNLVSVRIG
ncbi:MAG: hypothetical protein WCC81_18565, partial [Pseudolabrys sp.]